jgi:RHS repeat-associated protein
MQVQLTEYDPWGKISRSEGLADPTHRFTGQEFDAESDIHYYGGRYYDQNLGRFISPDPFVQDPDDPQNLNRYAYVLNGPQTYTDPSGYNAWSFFDGPSGSMWEQSVSDFRSMISDHVYPTFSAMPDSTARSMVSTSGWSGATNWDVLGSSAMHKDAVIEWDGMIAGPFGKYSIFDGTKYEAGLAKPSVNEVDAALLFMGGSTAFRAAGTGLRQIGGTASRFFYDPRKFGKISKEYWSIHGPANGNSLHHLFFPQSATWVPGGIRNAGFNLVRLPAARGVFHPKLGLNEWMGFAQNWGPRARLQANLMVNAIRVGVPAAAGLSGYLGYQAGGDINEHVFGEE